MRTHHEEIVVSPRALALLILGSVTAHVLFLVAGRTFLLGWAWSHEPLHAVIEALGAFIALSLAPMLHYLERSGRGTSHNRPIIHALIAMGILDLAHAVARPGNTFVWLHSIAVLMGGASLVVIWAPTGSLLTRIRPLHVATASVALAALAMTNPHRLPSMVTDGGFTRVAELINIVGGILFFVAAVRLIGTYRKTRRPDDLLFVVHCALFGAAAIMFQSSALWDAPWWGWHLLRLMAYLLALWFLVVSLRIEARALTARTREIETKQQALERSNADLQQFAYVAAHDLREPLRQVASFTELLAKRYGDQLDARAHEYIQHAVSGAVRMQRLIDDLLVFARAGMHDAAPEATDSNGLLVQVLGDLRTVIEESHAQVTHDALPMVMARPPQLARVFQNLLSNAIKFRGDAPPRVHVSAVRDGDMWRFSVTDNGIGIVSSEAGRIFQIFQRLHPRDVYPGTGIGLAIVERIVQSHGGRIWFESQPGAGTTFYFTVDPA